MSPANQFRTSVLFGLCSLIRAFADELEEHEHRVAAEYVPGLQQIAARLGHDHQRKRHDRDAQSMARLGEEIVEIGTTCLELLQNTRLRLLRLASIHDGEPPSPVFSDPVAAKDYLANRLPSTNLSCGPGLEGGTKTFFLLMGRSGEHEDRSEWPIALYENEVDAQAAGERAVAHAREYHDRLRHWYKTIFNPWTQVHPNWQPASEKPIAPEPQVNPDDPEHGVGDDYWVEAVPLRS